jgi:hypothetical protein
LNTIQTIAANPCLPAIIARTFHWKPVVIDEFGVRVSAISTGKAVVSLPHFSYGDIQFHDGMKPEDEEEALARLLKSTTYPSVELRYPSPAAPVGSTAKVLTCIDLSTDLWADFPSNLRRKIRKSGHNGFTVESGGAELLDQFYPVYARHMRSLGSAALCRNWFSELLSQYTGGFCGIFLLKRKGQTVGAAFNLEYNGFYENAYFAVLKPFQHQYGSYALYAALIKHAQQLNCTTFSFGRSTTDGGVHRFKQQWNTYDIPLVWLKSDQQVLNLRRYTWLHRIWKLIPYPLGLPVDHYIAKWVY